MVGLRNWMYDAGVLRVARIGVPVISVGNMTAGGTGKTPFVELLLRRLSTTNKKIAVVSRGYGRQTRGPVVVSDGNEILVSSRDGGDEPIQIATKFQKVIVIVDERRARGAEIAVHQFGAEVILLDDGFQHRSIGRDMDIVMIDGSKPLYNIRMIPAGMRREPMSGLRRAHALVLSASEEADAQDHELRRRSEAPILRSTTRPLRLRLATSGRELPLATLQGKSCVAFSGIGNPDAFRNTLTALGFHVRDELRFPDHHQYSGVDLQHILSARRMHGDALIVTTEKDFMRLSSVIADHPDLSDALYILGIETELLDKTGIVDGLLALALRKGKP